MTDVWRFCPQCGRRRVGYFRFCYGCKLDYDALIVAPPTPVVSTATPVVPETPGTAGIGAVPIAPAIRAFPPEQPAPTPTPAMPFVLTPPATERPEPAILQRETPTLQPDVPAVRPAPAPVGPGAHIPRADAAPGQSIVTALARRTAPLFRYAFIGLIALVAISVLTNMVSRATSGSPDATGGTAGATAVAPTTGIADPTSGVAEPIPTPSFSPMGDTQAAIVTSIVDGDTIRVEIDGTEYALRYVGIDAPEPDSADPALRAFADAATAANTALVEGEDVFLEKDVSETDTFDRLLRHVWIVGSNGSLMLVNAELVRLGMAEVTTFPPDEKYVDVYVAAEDEANEAGAGIWGPPPSAPAIPSASAVSSASPQVTPNSLVGGSTECHPSYDPCLPIVNDLDCADIARMGLAPIQVKGPDEYRLDFNGDGQGCERSVSP